MAQPARLTSSLLARKGRAFPANGLAATAFDLSQPLPSTRAQAAPCVTDASSMLEQARPRPAEPDRRKAVGDDRVALTVRLDPARHARLKILADRRQQTRQEILIKALDAYLQACGPDCACIQAETNCTGSN